VDVYCHFLQLNLAQETITGAGDGTVCFINGNTPITETIPEVQLTKYITKHDELLRRCNDCGTLDTDRVI
jgi:hypothetical protein